MAFIYIFIFKLKLNIHLFLLQAVVLAISLVLVVILGSFYSGTPIEIFQTAAERDRLEFFK